MRKSVFSVDVNDARTKKAAIQAVSGFQGIESLSIDSEKKTLTVIGDVDPVDVVQKLRKLKLFRADILTVGQNEEKEKEEVKYFESKQQEEMEQIITTHYNAYYPPYSQPYYYYPPYEYVQDPEYSR